MTKRLTTKKLLELKKGQDGIASIYLLTKVKSNYTFSVWILRFVTDQWNFKITILIFEIYDFLESTNLLDTD